MIDTILQQAVRYCEPSSKEVKIVTRIANEAKNLVSSYPSSKVVDISFGGSFAKGTWLRGDADIDIFTKIDESVDNEEFERLGMQIGLNSLKKYKPYLRYSDHPYVEAFINGIRVNIVPCYNIKTGNWKSAADRSPFHTEYVKQNLDDEKRQQVRLLKIMLKCIGAYGAEIAKNGFSGYVVEVLTLKYGSVESVFRAMSNIKKGGNVISIHQIDEDIIKTFRSPLIIIDPIDPRRNLGTAISPENVGKFVLSARAFLKKPSLEFFRKKEKHVKPYKEIYPNLLVMEFKHEQRSPDIIWGQLKKSVNAISKQLDLAGFRVIRNTCITDEKRSAAFLFLLECISLPIYTERIGPEIFRKNDTASFISKSSKKSNLMWINKQMRVTTLVKRKTTNAKDYLKFLVTKSMQSTGVTRGLKEDLQQAPYIYIANESNITGIVKEAIDELITTEGYVFEQN
jgi:tRNA nucleotidyltransferase (CCA-adding enzyme)